MFSHKLTCFLRLNKKSVKLETKEHIKLHIFYSKINTFISKIITIFNNFVGHKNLIDTCDVIIKCTNSIVLEFIWVSGFSKTVSKKESCLNLTLFKTTFVKGLKDMSLYFKRTVTWNYTFTVSLSSFKVL